MVFNLPISNRDEEKAIYLIIDYLQQQRESLASIRGFTHSLLRDAVYRGYWWSSQRQQWIRDKIVLFIIDYFCSPRDPVLTNHLRELKTSISNAYRRYGRAQEEIWIVASPVLRYINMT